MVERLDVSRIETGKRLTGLTRPRVTLAWVRALAMASVARSSPHKN